MATGAFIGSFALDSRFGLNAGFDVYDERYGKSNIACRLQHAGAARRRRRGRRDELDRHGSSSRGSRGCTCSIRTRRTRRRRRSIGSTPTRRTTARWRSPTRALAPLLDAARDASGRPTLVIVTGDHGEGLGDHGELTHGLFAYESTLRIPLIVAQVDRATPACGRGGPAWRKPPLAHLPCRSPHRRAPRGHRADRPRRSRPAEAGRPPGPHAAARAARHDDGPRSSYFEALSTMYNRGLGAAHRRACRSGQVHRPAAARAVRPRGSDPDGGRRTSSARKPERQRMLEATAARRSGPRRPPRGRPRTRLRARACRRSATSRARRAPKARYTEEDDPKRLVGVDRQLRRGGRAVRAAAAGGRDGRAQEGHRGAADDGGGLHAAGDAPVGGRASRPRRSPRCARPSRPGATASSSRRGSAPTSPRAAT